MLVVEAFLKNGTPEQYQRLDEAIKTAQFVRNKCLRYWMDNKGTTRNDLQKLCAVLAKNSTTPWVNKLNSQARQSSADRAWAAIARFYLNCHDSSIKKKGFPKFKKYSRSVEYKITGYVRFVSSKNGESKFKVYEEQEFNPSYRLNATLDNLMTMRVQVPLHRRNG